MTSKNKYVVRARISEAKFRELIRFFTLDIEANKIAVLARINRNTVNRYLGLIRARIADYCKSTRLLSVTNADTIWVEERENLLFERRTEGNDFHFGIIQVRDKVITEIISEDRAELARIVAQERDGLECRAHLRSLSSYSGIVDIKCQKLYCLKGNRNETEYEDRKGSRPEIFWAFAKSRLNKFNGISRSTFYLHLKECEFRFNHRNEDIYKLLLEIIRKNPLK